MRVIRMTGSETLLIGSFRIGGALEASHLRSIKKHKMVWYIKSKMRLRRRGSSSRHEDAGPP
jgi:hypothetical protein